MSFAPPLLKVLADQQTHLALLALDRTRRVDYSQPEFRNHSIVFFQNLSLEDGETLLWLVGPTEVHSCFVIFQVWSTRNDAIHGHVEWRSEEEGDRGFHCKRVDISDPRAIAATCDVARERGVDITICKHDRAGFEWRNDVALSAIGKVCRMKQRECRGRKQVTLLRAFCRVLDERRRVPFRKEDRITFGFQPLVKQCELC